MMECKTNHIVFVGDLHVANNANISLYFETILRVYFYVTFFEVRARGTVRSSRKVRPLAACAASASRTSPGAGTAHGSYAVWPNQADTKSSFGISAWIIEVDDFFTK